MTTDTNTPPQAEGENRVHGKCCGRWGVPLLAGVALIAALSGPLWSGPAYKALHLKMAKTEWQSRQEVEIGRLGQTVADLEARVNELGTALAKAREEAGVAKSAQVSAEGRMRVLALLQLLRALRYPAPFDAELKLARSATTGKLSELDPLLLAVEPYAAKGILVDSQLRKEFTDVADAISLSERRASVIGWIVNFVRWPAIAEAANLIVPGLPAPAPAAEPVADPLFNACDLVDLATTRMGDNDLKGAVEAIGKLSGDAAGIASGWLGEARARLAADQAIERIGAIIAPQLGTVGQRS